MKFLFPVFARFLSCMSRPAAGYSILFIVCALCLLPVPASSAGMPASGEDAHAPLGPDVIIPVPARYEISGDGVFDMDGCRTFHMKISGPAAYDSRDIAVSDLVSELLSLPYSLSGTDAASKADILINVGSRRHSKTMLSGQDESYRLSVTPDRIRIDAPGFSGAFYAIQSLVQMARNGKVRCCVIEDTPRFVYRGLHFDVSRHFRSKEFLMKQMDAMALLKLNRMHLHLTDGAGWRIETESWPRLTEFAAWRPYRRWTDWWASDRHYCEASAPGAYGGFYTKDDIRDIVAYARKKHIEVIPEIEMPGHSEEVLAAYPELSCTGEQYGGSDLCPGKEETFRFLEDVLSEVIVLFPSEYVHIGGDEASKQHWKTCPDCQRRMEEEGLADVDELQSYLIHRIEVFLNSKGKKIIGWDEILQGGLAPNATVMSWRGTEGGIESLKSGHDVVMVPNGWCYLDYTQDAPFKEPLSIGGYVPLEKTYSYEPVPEGLTEDETSHLLGIQGNLWTEYVTEDSHAEYMYYPRAFAIAETGWSDAADKDYGDFRRRALEMSEMFAGMGYNTFDLANEYGERKESLAPVSHLASGCKVTYVMPYSSQYPAAGDATLTDGVLGGWTYGDRKWQGFLSDADAVVDLGELKQIHYAGASFMQQASAWVYLPEKVEILVSDDGQVYRSAGIVWRDMPDSVDGLYFKTYGLVLNETCRYVRFRAERSSKAGAWLFTDELIIN